MRYLVTVAGCDDENAVQLELTDTELAVVKRVAEALTANSAFDCQPKMTVEPDGVSE